MPGIGDAFSAYGSALQGKEAPDSGQSQVSLKDIMSNLGIGQSAATPAASGAGGEAGGAAAMAAASDKNLKTDIHRSPRYEQLLANLKARRKNGAA